MGVELIATRMTWTGVVELGIASLGSRLVGVRFEWCGVVACVPLLETDDVTSVTGKE